MRKQEEMTHPIDLQSLLKHLSRLVEWETFGALVGVPLEVLRRIKEEHGSVQSRVMHLLAYWVEDDDNVSWSRVIEALKEIPGEKHLAENVSEAYGQTQALESSTDVVQIIPLKEDEELAHTLEEIRLKFTRLVLNIEKTLKKEVEKKEIDFDDALSFVCTYLHLTLEPQPENTRQLFSRLQPHYCFMSYKILKLIVLEFVEVTMGRRMEKYGNELSNWLESTTVQEFKVAVEKAANPETVDPSPNQCPIVLRLEGEWLEVTLKSLWKLLEYLFGKKSSILTRIRIEKGSVLVYLFAPQSEMLSLLALSSKKYEEMVSLGIKSIEVGGLCFTSIYSTFDIPFTFETSLGAAIQNKCQPALIRFLLEIETDPNGDNAVYPPLIMAAMSNNMEALSLLMEYNVDVFMFTKQHVSAIHMAAYHGNVEIVEILLKAGVPPDHHDPVAKLTPLVAAASSDQKEVVKLLLQNGADKDFQSINGYSALMFACKAGSVITAQVLLKAGANPDLRTIAHPVSGTEGGMTALNVVCYLPIYAEDIVKLLLKYNADPNISSDDGRTPLMVACFLRQHNVVHLLLQAGAKVNLQTDHNATALLLASMMDDTALVSLLLNANAEVNVQDSVGVTALYWACRNGNNEMIECLLKAKADPKLCTHDGESPLLVYTYTALSSLAKPSILAALLKAGADPNAFKKTSSITPLHMACFCGQKDIIHLLLEAKANVNALDDHGNTPLCIAIAAGNGRKDIVELLLSAGADIELEKNGNGWTPLFLAVIIGHLDVIKILIQNGASIKRNRYGETPQDYAAQMGHMEIFEFLSKASSKKTRVEAKKISLGKQLAAMKTASNVQPNSDILSHYHNPFSPSPESIKQFQDKMQHSEYNLMEATKSRPKIAISSEPQC